MSTTASVMSNTPVAVAAAVSSGDMASEDLRKRRSALGRVRQVQLEKRGDPVLILGRLRI